MQITSSAFNRESAQVQYLLPSRTQWQRIRSNSVQERCHARAAFLFSRNERVLGIRFIFTLHVLLTGLLWPGEDEKKGCTRSSLMIKDTGDAKIALAPQKLMFFFI